DLADSFTRVPLDLDKAELDEAEPDEATISADLPVEYARSSRWPRLVALIGALVLMFAGQFQIYDPAYGAPTSSAYILIMLGLAIFFVVLNGTILTEHGVIPMSKAVHTLRVRW